jgi:transposase
MSKLSPPAEIPPRKLFCGVDVSAQTLAVAVHVEGQPFQQRDFANTAAGHKALIAWLGKGGAHARVSLESTGIYSMDLALALDGAPHIELAVLNPKDVHRFASSLRRSKTDAADAQALAEYSLRMPFTPWRAPSPTQLQLRSLSRYIDSLTLDRTRIKNRLHGARGCALTPPPVLADLKRSLASVAKRILQLRRQAMLLVRADRLLGQRFDLLTGIPGVAQVSALQLLGELALLSHEMSARQWVAHSGLDPAHQVSGTSIHKASRISRAGNRNLRRVLYMPALVAIRHDPHLKAFYQNLVARHKAKMQALIAVARKLLHAIYGIFKTNTQYDGRKLFPHLQTA